MEIQFCDDRGAAGFSWIADEPATRTSHALASGGGVWLVDPVRHEPALARTRELGEPRAVIQLLDRHNRDCAAVAAELGVAHLVVPDAVADSPFVIGAPPAAAHTPAENDWRAAIEARLASLESEIAELKAGRTQ